VWFGQDTSHTCSIYTASVELHTRSATYQKHFHKIMEKFMLQFHGNSGTVSKI